MEDGHRLNLKKAIDHFLSHFEGLLRLPFVADEEMEQIYGREVVTGLARLDNYNQEKQLCRKCISRCCKLVKCELYSESLSCCPVFFHRPILCRMHFCNRYVSEYPVLVKDLGDIFLDGFLSAQEINNQKVNLLDSPPLENAAPGLIAKIKFQIKQFEKNKTDETKTLGLIRSIVEDYRTDAV